MGTPITLTDEFERALALLDAGRNLFLTGKAGTGKSTLIRHFMATTERRVVVAAQTGIAALNVDCYT
ncbi:MAG: helicase, partial [Cellulomonas sp.]